MPIWPESKYILFEPLEERAIEIENLKRKYKEKTNIEHIKAAAGKEPDGRRRSVAGRKREIRAAESVTAAARAREAGTGRGRSLPV